MVAPATSAQASARLLSHELQRQAGDAHPELEHRAASGQERRGVCAAAFGLVHVLRVGDRLTEDGRREVLLRSEQTF